MRSLSSFLATNRQRSLHVLRACLVVRKWRRITTATEGEVREWLPIRVLSMIWCLRSCDRHTGRDLEQAVVQICLANMFQNHGWREPAPVHAPAAYCSYPLGAILFAPRSYELDRLVKGDLASHHVIGAFDMTRTHGEAALRQTA